MSDRIGSCFGRPEVPRRARVYLEVLLANVPRKNDWQLAEHAGDATPKNIQHFLGRAKRTADDVRDDLQQYVVKHLAHMDGVLIIDETGFTTVVHKEIANSFCRYLCVPPCSLWLTCDYAIRPVESNKRVRSLSLCVSLRGYSKRPDPFSVAPLFPPKNETN